MSDVSTAADLNAPQPAASEEAQPEVTREEPVNLEAQPEPEGQPEPTVEDDSEEIEYDGEKYRVPKKLKAGFMMNADYTRKTQAHAESVKSFEAERETARQNDEMARAHVRDIGRVQFMNEQLGEFAKVNWQQLEQEDPFKAEQLWRQRTMLKEQRDSLAAQVQDNERKRSQSAQQDFAKRYEETSALLSDPEKGIKGWNQETADKLAQYGKQNGLTDADIRQFAVNPAAVKLLHRAWMGDQLLEKQRTQAKTAEPRVEAKPVRVVTGSGAKTAIDIHDEKTSMDDYVAQRRKQGFGKR